VQIGPWCPATFTSTINTDGKRVLLEVDAYVHEAGREFIVAFGRHGSEREIAVIFLRTPTAHPMFKFTDPIEIPDGITHVSMRGLL